MEPPSATLSPKDRAVLAGGGLSLAGVVVWCALQLFTLNAQVAALAAKVETLTQQIARMEAGK